MKNPVLFLLILIVVIGCNRPLNQDNSQLTDLNGLSEADAGSQLDLNPITHGDTPVWWGAMDDIDKLETLLNDLDEISVSDLEYRSVPVLGFSDEGQFSKVFSDFFRSDSIRDVRFKNDEGLVIFADGKIKFIELLSFENLSLSGLKMSEFTIVDAANKYPKSYGVRNFYGDTFRSRFYDGSPNSYDHLKLKVSGTNLNVHLRFTDQTLTHFSVE